MLPSIVVMVVSKKVGKAAFVNEGFAVRHKHMPSSNDSYYEIWLVDATVENYLLALEAVIENHFQLKLTDEKRQEILTRVARVHSATIDASEGK